MTSCKFSRAHRIRFAECDPAGIVFYPQYFVMFNNLLEAWFDKLIPEVGFSGFIGKLRFGVPSVRLEADFLAVSRMGDDVILALEVVRIGGTSLTLELTCCDLEGGVRVRVKQVLVATSLDTHRPVDLPNMLRLALTHEPTISNERSGL